MTPSNRSAKIPLLVHDAQRLAALEQYEIVNTPAEASYDAITRLVAQICDAPVALISLVENDRQWFKSNCGFDQNETPLQMSICAHALSSDGLFVVPDTTLDTRTKENPLVVGAPFVRFYAGAPLRTPDGQAIGSLCVLDVRPRKLTDEQRTALSTLGEHVMNLLELRRTIRLRDEEIARREKVEAELQIAKEAAEASGRAKDQFFATLSHELRTPLTPVLITAAAMAADDELAPAARDIWIMIQRNVQHEVRLIDDLLEVSRIISGKLELVKQPLDVHAVVDESIAMCKSEAEAKAQDLSIELRATRPFVAGDASRLRQVVCNLIRNAIRFTPRGGRIRVDTADADKSVRISVVDTGVGMDPHRIASMFEPFEQADRPATASGGLGLGLAIAKGFVQAHGGAISAHSDGRGKGATFTVDLPASGVPLVIEKPIAPRRAQSSLRILLVEDHEDSRRAMKKLLTVLKHEVSEAATIADGWAAAEAGTFDLVISDVGLPDGSGLDFMRRLCARGPTTGIALTGYGTEADVAAARDAGFATHLTKPINFTALQSAIRDVTQ